MDTPAETTSVRDLLGQPLKSPAELVPFEPAAAPAVSPTSDAAMPPAAATIAESRERLVARCHQLRASHRCPGRCIVTGELGRGGLAAFQRITDGSR